MYIRTCSRGSGGQCEAELSLLPFLARSLARPIRLENICAPRIHERVRESVRNSKIDGRKLLRITAGLKTANFAASFTIIKMPANKKNGGKFEGVNRERLIPREKLPCKVD